ncbi:MAG TPA: DUF2062 domain-containing protein [Hydrogenophaga sp.]|jgi:hypothetical protein|uniref:DUF2062 domain-containing protein n=1 Tax=Hydrogenophaga sp. TaxID=1904254 RepID=UPI0008AFAC69|nr:DUF2062 domain-containing protein [Hydrogenophaga sp.]MBU4183987.1 DUF2062 domain-containing protein [Gammaproteobacteria bacterium]MBW8468209.1 DUF2062 domain-containing protein [Thiobacillus sp.]OGA77938.1 MAG: hypothetical protein A2X73_22005 [Burkholderiales bacterium GWE1_65_30]OGA94287.1 MAG: hypothetical protein A2X72_02625 [Burkholderiales bacterium GWF1_66_17]PKO78088.1 MAG: DUF2062 domain-containing protein [Betaproteobacteria bacterium HGW-Betaproteobacteria-15]
MKKRLKAWLPSSDSIRNNRWLRWLGPTLHHPRLWHFSRKGIAMGLALGIFFGLLVPVAQMPLSAAAAVILRANLPMAVASTLVTNPVTFGPVYYGAYRVGKAVLGEPPLTEAQASALLERAVKTQQAEGWKDRLEGALRRLATVGKPLVVGLAIVATVSGLAVYFIISAIWTLRVRWSRSRRLKDRVTRLKPSADQP